MYFANDMMIAQQIKSNGFLHGGNPFSLLFMLENN